MRIYSPRRCRGIIRKAVVSRRIMRNSYIFSLYRSQINCGIPGSGSSVACSVASGVVACWDGNGIPDCPVYSICGVYACTDRQQFIDHTAFDPVSDRGGISRFCKQSNVAHIYTQGTIEVRDKDADFPSRGALNIDAARRDFNYDPLVDVEEGFQAYYEWLTNSSYWSKFNA